MKILSVLHPLFEQLLIEANLINGKDPYNGISLEKFVADYAANLATQEASQMFIKKLSRLLMADERFLYAVRELPPGAPEWAQAAMEKGDLVYFNPTPELKDHIENVSHYVAALEQDMQSTDGNVKANATRDFQGFTKAANLDMLVQKTNEYFARGAKKQEATDTEGMKKVLEAPGGFTWYVLEEPAAFYREGKTLKNCIGRVYTAESTKRSNTKIYVLRDSNNRSIVATRIVGSEMAEVKGSNNGPPIPRYMPAVQKLINTFNITLGSGGKSDVGNSGYYYHEGILYSRTQAVAKLVKTEKLFDIPSTSAYVTRVVSASDDLIRDLYTKHARGYWRLSDAKVFEVRAGDGDPVVSFIVSGKNVEAVLRYEAYKNVTEAEEPAPSKTPMQRLTSTALQMLAQQGFINGVSDEVQKELFWQDSAVWDSENKAFSYRTPERQHKTSAKGSHTLDVYTGEQAKALVRTFQPSGRYYDEEHREREVPTKNVKAVYTATVRKATGEVSRPTDKILVVVEYNDGNTALYSVRGSDVDMSNAGFTREGSQWSSEYVRDGKTVNTLVALANEQGFKLPTRFTVGHGLSYTSGQYAPLKALEPTEIPGDPSAVMFDLRELDTMDRATVLARAISVNDTKPHMSPLANQFKFRGVTSGLGSIMSHDRDVQAPEDTKKAIDKWTKEVFGTPVTTIYRVNIVYGAGNNGGKVSLVASGKEVVHIDSETLDHTWQSRDDYQKVSDQLNKFATAHGLTFARTATSKSPQLRVNKGQIIPAEALAKSKMERSLKREKGLTSRVGVMTFDDGYTAKKMSESDYGTWSAHGIQKPGKGIPWEIADEDGNVKAIVMVTRSGELTAMYANPNNEPGKGVTYEVNGRQLPIVRTVDTQALKYVKRMAREFKWGSVSSQFTVTGNDRYTKLLRSADSRRRKSIQLYRQYVAPQGEEGAHYVDTPDFMKFALPLVNAGIFRAAPVDKHTSRQVVTLTPRGEEVLGKLNRGETVNLTSYVTSANLHPDYEHPAEPEPAPREQREPRAAQEPGVPRAPRQPMEGGGSKADQALARFREMTQANNGEMPSRSEFIRVLTQPPFNMTPAGASTYQYNTKAKYLRERGEVNENFTFIEFLTHIL